MKLIRLPLSLLLIVYQSAFLSLSQIWTNKVRSTLTTLGIIIGVASVTGVISALTGLKSSVLAAFEDLGTNKIFVFPDWRSARHGNIPWERVRFKPEYFNSMLDYCPSLSGFTRMTGLNGQSVSYNGRSEQQVSIMGVEPAWHKIENRTVIQGRPFSLIDDEQARPVCLINAKAQQTLGLPADCAGQSIMVGKSRMLVIGVIETKTESSMFGNEGTGLEVFLPFSLVRQLNPYSNMHVVAASRSPEVSEEAKAEITFFLRGKRAIRPGEPNTFGVEAVEQFVQKFSAVSAMVTAAASGVVGISLLVGGVGIMNIMLVSVSERTREIGLRKAVGARPSAIMLQFLVEAVMLCLMGGLLGLAGGQTLTWIMKSIPAAHLEKAYIPAWAVGLSFGFAAAVGLIFGMFPAIKAARLDPIEALRHE
jgi:putative ABC transport system permease protein